MMKSTPLRYKRYKHAMAAASALPLLGLCAGFLFLPVGWTLFNSLMGSSGMGFENYRRIWESPFLIQSFRNSLKISLWSSLVGTSLGLAAAISIRQSRIGSRMLWFYNMVNNFSGVPLAFAFIVVLGTQGALTIMMRSMGLEMDLYSSAGLITLYTYFQLPLAVLTLYPALDSVGRDLLEASRTLGASDRCFWVKVGLPILMPSIRGTFCLLFANSMGAYATAYALTSGNSNLVPLRISAMAAGDVFLDFPLASAMSSVLLVITVLGSVLGLAGSRGAFGRNDDIGVLSAQPPFWPVRLLGWLTMGFLALPVAATALHSLSSRWGASILPDGLSPVWYLELIGDPRFISSVLRSLALSFGAVGLAATLVIPPAVITRCTAPRCSWLLDVLCLIPLVVPPVVSSVGLLSIYSKTPIGGTPVALLLSYSVLCLPFMGRAILSALDAVNPRELTEAAMTLGCSMREAISRAVLPNLWKGITAGAMLSFTSLMGEFVLANILVGTRFETMQVYMFNRRGVSGHLMSAMVMIHFAMAAVLSHWAWQGQSRWTQRIRSALPSRGSDKSAEIAIGGVEDVAPSN